MKKCDHCDKSFKSGAGLASHIKGILTPAVTKKKCRRCGAYFYNKDYEERRKPAVFCSKSCAAKERFTGKQKSLEHRQKLSKVRKEWHKNNPEKNPFYGRTPENYNGWGYGGYVEELGFSVRSTWERDYLVALKNANIPFNYEDERFDLGKGRGTYLPDIHLIGTNVYIEITGWDKPEKVRKRKLFKENFDIRLHVIYEKPTQLNIKDLVEFCKGVMKEYVH